MNTQKQKIARFLAAQNLAVLSTVSKAKQPQGAVVAFAEKKDLGIVFGTSDTSRKYKNLVKNPNVSFVIGWSMKDQITVQYEGVATELSGKDREKQAKILIQKNRFAAKFHELPDQKYFAVAPRFIRYSDYKEGDIFEISF